MRINVVAMKVISISVFFVLFLSQICLVTAQTPVNLTISSVNTAINGEPVTVEVRISPNSNVCGGELLIGYPSEYIQIKSASAGNLINANGSFDLSNTQYGSNEIRIAWVTTDASTINSGGILYRITFELKNGISINKIPIEFKKVTTLVDINHNPVAYLTTNGSISISTTPIPNPTPIQRGGGGLGVITVIPTPATTPTPTIEPEPTLQPTPTTQPPQFNDLGNVEWAKDSIQTLVEAGIVQGIGGQQFDPDNTVTRAEFTKMIVVAFAVSGNTQNTFSDVNQNDWFYPYVCAAASEGIINGVSDTEFAPELPINREEAAVLLYRASLKIGLDLSKTVSGQAFEDQISPWAVEAVNVLQLAGVVQGKGAGIFDPFANMSRAEAAKVVCTIYQLIQNK